MGRKVGQKALFWAFPDHLQLHKAANPQTPVYSNGLMSSGIQGCPLQLSSWDEPFMTVAAGVGGGQWRKGGVMMDALVD